MGIVAALGSPEAAGCVATAGFDFVLVDLQHGRWHINTAHAAFRSIFAGGAVPMARVEQNDFFAIGSVLDRGALGIVVPMVETRAQAEAVAAAARYGPLGKRSIGGGEMRSFLGVGDDEVNDEIFVAVQIETVAGVENAADILSVDGVDGCWIGPSDLQLSMGVDLNDPAGYKRHQEAIEHVITTCRRLGKIPGIAEPGRDAEWLKKGCTFVTIGSESSIIRRGSRSLLQSYQEIGK